MIEGRITRIDAEQRSALIIEQDGAEHLVRFPAEAIIEVSEPETVGTMGGEFEDLEVGYHVVVEGRNFADDGSCTCVSLECIS